MTPRVSICVAVYQSERHLQETLDSVWAQEFEDFELVVVDDRSTDASAAILAAQADPRLRVLRHPVNRGQAQTVTDAIAAARGELVKLLDHDDLLDPDCVGAMVAALDANAAASFAFSHRRILAEDPDDPELRRWIEDYGRLPAGFERVGAVNDGAELLRQILAPGLPRNWIAEPAGVMARRRELVAVGGYNQRVRQANDLDLWLRLMARGEVVYIDRPLYTYRLHHSGVTGVSQADDDRRWLDGLWTFEGLAAIDGFPEPAALRRARRLYLKWALRRAAGAVLREPPRGSSLAADLLGYAAFRAAAAAGRAPRLSLPIVPAEPG